MTEPMMSPYDRRTTLGGRPFSRILPNVLYEYEMDRAAIMECCLLMVCLNCKRRCSTLCLSVCSCSISYNFPHC